MSASTIASVVLGALLALAVAYIVHLRHQLVVPVAVGPVPAAPVMYGRRVGDRLADYGDRVHFSDVYELVGLTDSRDDHGTNITDSLFTTGKAVA